MNKILLLLSIVMLTACADPKTIVVPEIANQLNHPEVIPVPAPPGVSVKVITKERIMKGELDDRAYIGFSYPDWLEFSKWMHDYKTYNKSLKSAVEQYKSQDSRSTSD